MLVLKPDLISIRLSVTGIYVGAMAAKKGAEILEEFNIFTPEDDDD